MQFEQELETHQHKNKKGGGQTNRNWIVQYKERKFFVRFPWERTDIVDREIEAKNILALTKCRKLVGVVPKYFIAKKRFNLSDGAMVMEYIEGKDVDGKDLEKSRSEAAFIMIWCLNQRPGNVLVGDSEVF